MGNFAMGCKFHKLPVSYMTIAQNSPQFPETATQFNNTSAVHWSLSRKPFLFDDSAVRSVILRETPPCEQWLCHEWYRLLWALRLDTWVQHQPLIVSPALSA